MKNSEKQVYPLQNHNGTILQAGLTKREYFAGLAMQGIINQTGIFNSTEDVCKKSVRIADELLKQLENETTK